MPRSLGVLECLALANVYSRMRSFSDVTRILKRFGCEEKRPIDRNWQAPSYSNPHAHALTYESPKQRVLYFSLDR